MRPLVSTVIPTYNRATSLREAIDSVYAQEGLGEEFDVELIVVDDASSDGTPEVVRGYPAVKYIRRNSNRGIPAATRNEGIRASQGAFIALLDDDDLWLPHKLRLQVPALEDRPDVGLVYSNLTVRIDTSEQSWLEGKHPPSGLVFQALLKEYFTHTDTILIRRKVFEKVGYFDETLSVCDDWDMWLRIAFHFPFLYVPGIVAIHRPALQGLSHTRIVSGEAWREQQVVLEKALAMLPDTKEFANVSRESHAHVDMWNAEALAWLGQSEQMTVHLERALKTMPDLIVDMRARESFVAMARALARSSDSPITTLRAFCHNLATAADGEIHRLEALRRILADVWTSAAIALGTGRRVRYGAAGYAAARAMLMDLSKLRRKVLWWLLVRGVLRNPRDVLEALGTARSPMLA